MQNRNRVTAIESKLTVTRGGRNGGGINWKLKTDIYKLQQITNKDLLYSTENSFQYLITTYMREESKKDWIYACV